jgi:hypothetical protein
MGHKTKVTITAVPWPEDPVRRKNLHQMMRDANWARRTRTKGLNAANEPKQQRAAQGKAIALKIADDLIRQGKRATAKSVLKNWPKDSKAPPIRTVSRYISKKK